METDPMYVTLDRYNELEARWVRSEEHRRKLIDALVELVDKNYGYTNGYLAEKQLSRRKISLARAVLVEVTEGTLKDSDKERPFYKGQN